MPLDVDKGKLENSVAGQVGYIGLQFYAFRYR